MKYSTVSRGVWCGAQLHPSVNNRIVHGVSWIFMFVLTSAKCLPILNGKSMMGGGGGGCNKVLFCRILRHTFNFSMRPLRSHRLIQHPNKDRKVVFFLPLTFLPPTFLSLTFLLLTFLLLAFLPLTFLPGTSVAAITACTVKMLSALFFS